MCSKETSFVVVCEDTFSSRVDGGVVLSEVEVSAVINSVKKKKEGPVSLCSKLTVLGAKTKNSPRLYTGKSYLGLQLAETPTLDGEVLCVQRVVRKTPN